jgi:hypothetical protein
VSKDHIIPKSSNGSNNYRNKIWVCATCNSLIKKNKVYALKKLPSKTKKDHLGKIYIESINDRIDYIAGIRGVIMNFRRTDPPIV